MDGVINLSTGSFVPQGEVIHVPKRRFRKWSLVSQGKRMLPLTRA